MTITLSQICAWFQANYLAEPGLNLTSFEHAAQTAELAIGAGADGELVVAAFLHDVGHAEAGPDHGRWARERLRGAFGERVLWLIEHHITAKRYACATDAQYYARLSADSRRTYALQGGPLSPPERAAFAIHPWFEDAVRLRRWDDAAKRGGYMPRSLGAYLEQVEQLMARPRAAQPARAT
jgi:predicted HD phosphohydrolase